MSRRRRSKDRDDQQIKKLTSLIVQETEDDERLFLEAFEKVDPRAVKEKLAGAEASQESAGVRQESSKNSSVERGGVIQLDLHGLHLADAQLEIDRVIAEILRTRRGESRIMVITGKGRHSGPGGPVLARKIHEYVRSRWSRHIVSIEESPAEATFNGLPVRGHFHVILRS